MILPGIMIKMKLKAWVEQHKNFQDTQGLHLFDRRTKAVVKELVDVEF
jgi:hypothetical protein